MAALVGYLGDMDLAEEAAQEAFAIAAERWPRDGLPQHPVAWLVATGRNRTIDRMRRERTLEDKTQLLEADQPAATMDEIDLDDSTIPDERLELIFTCCHPALAVDAQVALTLRALGGLTTRWQHVKISSRLLGQIYVTEEADQGRHDPAPLAPEDLLDQCTVSTGTSTSGRTSTAPPSRTAGIRCATSSASSRLDASNTK